MSIHVTINGQSYKAEQGQTILQVFQSHGIFIPTLCHHPDLPPCGKCGLCVVRIDGGTFVYACMQPARNKMIIDTKSADVIEKAKKSLESFFNVSQPPPSPEIEEIVKYLNPKNPVRPREHDRTNAITFDPTECINCGRCIRICSDILNIGALNEPNPRMRINECISCGMCISICPTNSLQETPSIAPILRALVQNKIIVLQLAPSVRVSVGELFGEPIGTLCTEKIIAAARQMGISYVLDTQYGADVTIVEEATELVERLKNKKGLPMFTSCCPSWVNFVERSHPELTGNLSTTKSPHMIVGKLIKTYFADRLRLKETDIFTVSLMPCVSKKDEVKRMQLIGDFDAVITAREFGKMVKDFGIEWTSLKGGEFDHILGNSSGAGAIFGVSGGVTEATVRYAHEILTGKKIGEIEYHQFRGNLGSVVKTADISFGDTVIKMAVCSGISAARDLIESENYKKYHFIEVMSCPGGCIAGGGQPKLPSRELAINRAKTLYDIDKNQIQNKLKTAADNTEVTALYKLFLEKPGSHKAHNLLHTHYEPQETAMLANIKRLQTQPIVGFGSSTGTATRLARIVGGFIKTVSGAMNSLTLTSLIKRKTAIFIVSTTGDGEFPTNCKKFIENLRESNIDLSEVRYAVCGLGSRAYNQFCLAGKQLDLIMEEHHAKQIIPFIPIDTSTEDRGETLFERWCLDLCTALGLPPPRIGVNLMYRLTPDNDDSVINNPLRPLKFEKMTIKNRSLLTAKNYMKEIFKLDIKMPAGMSYKPGGIFLIFPQNPPEMAKEVIQVLGYDPNQVFQIHVDAASVVNFIPERVSIEQLFTMYLDLKGPPNRSLLRAFMRVANNEGIEKIQNLLDINNENGFNEYLKDIDIATCIKQFAQYGVPQIDSLVSSCPHIIPRKYSIASAPIKNRGFISLVVSTLQFGNNRVGLCSDYLRNEKTSKIYMRIMEDEDEDFSELKENPMILVATGRGIGSIISILELRQYDDGPFGKCILFYGCQSGEGYKPLIDELQEFKKNGAVDEVYVACSRDTEKKQYVQDAMREQQDKLWELWQDPQCSLIYSGFPGTICDDIISIMIEIAETFGDAAVDEAREFYDNHNVIWRRFD
ncbi:Iron only hydrogenase large subunit, C-terminal domain containing protein [Tritrichomonas foetus]|uniref:NADPH--hemoprotein reductase n=1 Tax=Tritrichomonas foetus TaxID=1144522 RepID=A0A1J4L2A1_9EUKA|nr:Iron only hydrogenase large subunit, C-terminal domain containing protein [Tritrichomonas foetus]|eukprot:OHT16021.1 Iron only hydrogenase large subunit, C-terminal domain containing protein [Tritrichomonas foetus]